jgi:nucleotide-binding universal stress UspA family protein
MIAISRILVATDVSPGSETALDYGRELARTFGAQLDLLHVVDDVAAQLIMAGRTWGGSDFVDLQRDLEAAAASQLDDALREDDRRELRARATVRTHTGPAQGIVTYAADTGADLIVIGTHGRGGVSHLLLGSIAERVVRTAPCPVLTVRHPEREFVRPDALQKVEHGVTGAPSKERNGTT